MSSSSEGSIGIVSPDRDVVISASPQLGNNAAMLLDHHDCRRNIADKSTIVHIDDGARGWNAWYRVEASVRS
jgi:hypothetical protein